MLPECSTMSGKQQENAEEKGKALTPGQESGLHGQ